MVADARKLGATIAITTGVGDGYPDWTVGYRQRTFLVERKAKPGRLEDLFEDSQIVFYRRWNGGPIVLIESQERLMQMLTVPDLDGWLQANNLCLLTRGLRTKEERREPVTTGRKGA